MDVVGRARSAAPYLSSTFRRFKLGPHPAFGVSSLQLMNRSLSPFRTLFNLTGLNRESQRDSVTQPSGCRVGEATLGLVGHSLPTPTGLQHGRVRVDATPLGFKRFSVSFPRVARAEQPWAKRRNLVGIREAGHKVLRIDTPQQLSRGEGEPSPDSLICDGNLRLSVSFALTGLTISEPPNPGLHPGLSSCAPSGLNSQHRASLELRPVGFPWALGIGPWSL